MFSLDCAYPCEVPGAFLCILQLPGLWPPDPAINAIGNVPFALYLMCCAIKSPMAAVDTSAMPADIMSLVR